MSQGKQKLAIVVGLLLILASTAFAGDLDYEWETWSFPTKIECCLLYDGDGDGQAEEYHPVATRGFMTFKAGFPFDRMVPAKSGWSMVFASENGSEIKLVNASWDGHANTGRKENVYIHPEHQSVKYFYEAVGTWCGYDSARDVYFWGRWSTEGKAHYADYVLNGSSPSLQGRWIIEGCSDCNCEFECSDGTFFSARLGAE